MCHLDAAGRLACQFDPGPQADRPHDARQARIGRRDRPIDQPGQPARDRGPPSPSRARCSSASSRSPLRRAAAPLGPAARRTPLPASPAATASPPLSWPTAASAEPACSVLTQNGRARPRPRRVRAVAAGAAARDTPPTTILAPPSSPTRQFSGPAQTPITPANPGARLWHAFCACPHHDRTDHDRKDLRIGKIGRSCRYWPSCWPSAPGAPPTSASRTSPTSRASATTSSSATASSSASTAPATGSTAPSSPASR